MAQCNKCNVCRSPGTLSESAAVYRIPSNVRRFRDEVFTVWRCSGCGSLHCAEDADLPKYYADYPLKQQKLTFSENIGYGNRLKLLTRLGLQPASSILDYGCGAGLFVEFLKKRGYSNVSGYDPFVPAFAGERVLDSRYDAVVSYDVIEHHDEPREFMAAVARLVKPGGLLAIGTPNADRIPITRPRDPNLHQPYHRHILSQRALLDLGAEQGLQVAGVHLRSFYDSLVPTVNSRFMWRYIDRSGGFLDAAVEPPRTGLILRSPDLLFFAFFGYFVPLGDNMIVTFRKPAE